MAASSLLLRSVLVSTCVCIMCVRVQVHPLRVIFMISRDPPPGLADPQAWSDTFRDFLAQCLQKVCVCVCSFSMEHKCCCCCCFGVGVGALGCPVGTLN